MPPNVPVMFTLSPRRLFTIQHHVTEVDADAESHTTRLGQVSVLAGDRQLDVDGAAQCLDGACKLWDDTVACATEDPAFVPSTSPSMISR